MMRAFLWGVAVALLFISCEQSALKYEKPYFDFDSLIRNQVKVLGKSRWKKISQLNQKGDTVLVQPDSMRNELDIFTQLDVINKPVMKGKYLIEEKKDMHSNLRIRRYTFLEDNKEKVKSHVPYVEFYYYKQFADLRKIVSVFQEQNLLFNSTRKLTLELEEAQPKKITSYQIKGFQKMMLADTVRIDIASWRMD
jgi:hypothetical protein